MQSLKRVDVPYIILIFFYKALLDFVYVHIMTDMYSYEGYISDGGRLREVLSYFILVLFIRPILRSRNGGRSSDYMLYLIQLIYFIPMLTIFGFSSCNPYFILFVVAYWACLAIFSNLIHFKNAEKKVPTEISEAIFSAIVFSFAVADLFVCIIYNGFSFHFSLNDIYDLRAAQEAMDIPTVLGYIQPIASSIIPVAFIYYMINGRKVIGFALLVILFSSFSFGGSKSIFFSVFLCVLVYFFYNNRRKYFIISALVFLTLAALFEYYKTSFSFIVAYFHNRTCFAVDRNSYFYFDFFQSHELLYLRDSLLRWLGFSSPYHGDIAKIIGDIYYGNPLMNCNNGLCGDAYANYGFMGCVIHPLLLIIAFKILDRVSFNVDCRIKLMAAILFTISFTNVSFFGVLLSNGFIVFCISVYFIPFRKNFLAVHPN